MLFRLQSILTLLLLCRSTTAFPPWASLAGLSDEEIDVFSRTVKVIGAQPPPGPDPNTLTTLVNDAAHPFQPPGPNDIRGPCPGLNTLASHGVTPFHNLPIDISK
jgi:unspecific peroxygenase